MRAVFEPPLSDLTAHDTEPRDSLLRFWRPRFWPTWLFVGWLKASAALPWRLAIGIHEAFGGLLWRLLKRRRRIVERNLELCFPELDRAAVEALARRHFANVGATIAEIAFAWFAPERRVAPLMHIAGVEHLHAALAKGRGVLLLSGHSSTLEICSPFVKNLVPTFAFMYRPRNNPLLDTLQSRGRRRASHVSFSNTDIRALLRALKRNGVVWYAPDQARSGSGGELQTFFGQPAMTNTGTSRIARVSGAAVVPFFFCRLDDGTGYRLRFDAALDGLTGDTTADTRLVTGVIEGFVRECPAQYLWMHRKFKDRPALPDAYSSEAPQRPRSGP
jgi:KDO2-lipid IV(A) lauroyltransferase